MTQEVAPSTLESPEHVLSTLEKDGTRRWISPRLSDGRYFHRRRVVAWVLMAFFFFLPFVRGESPFFGVAGKPLFLLDIAARKFRLFGYTFLPTDTFLLALGMLFVFVAIFLFTAVFGRVWCGWACPQTVYLEFLYRPLQRLFEGTMGRGGAAKKQSVARQAGYFVVALLVTAIPAHTFLAYFVGVENLFQWMRRSPFDHPTAFLVMAATTGLMFFNFYWFREQLCLIACPYGRFQSVLLDRHSMIVTYDSRRGEPRGKKTLELPVVGADGRHGDCVDCHMCVATCPTGIDIRNGLQMECVNCTQCMDACDAVMDKVGRARGLIRYSSQAAMEAAAADGGKPRTQGKVRFRTLFYPVLLLILGSAGLAVFLSMGPANVTVLRSSGTPYTVVNEGAQQWVVNPLKLKITNRTAEAALYTLRIVDCPEARIAAAENPLAVGAGATLTTSMSIEALPTVFEMGRREVWLEVTDSDGFSTRRLVRLLGPFGSAPSTTSAPGVEP